MQRSPSTPIPDGGGADSGPTACPDCLRRAQLLALLAPYIERAVAPAPGSHKRIADWLALPGETLAEVVAPGRSAAILRSVDAPTDDRLAAEAEASGCWSVCRHQRRYPVALSHDNAPAALFGRGDPRLLSRLCPDRAVAIVGSRRATSYGREVARTLGRDLAEAGLAVVSGLAFGIDACAHRGSLEAGLTVAVLGCGADVAYPASHRSLWRRIQESGLVLSELPPGTGAWRWSFPARNRIVAALAGMTVVVEAAERSGSLVTAGFARELGRQLGAVPGPVGSPASVGANGLLASGATLVRSAADVREEMPGSAVLGIGSVTISDPMVLQRSAEAIIGEDRVPSEVLADLVSTYGPEKPCE